MPGMPTKSPRLFRLTTAACLLLQSPKGCGLKLKFVAGAKLAPGVSM